MIGPEEGDYLNLHQINPEGKTHVLAGGKGQLHSVGLQEGEKEGGTTS